MDPKSHFPHLSTQNTHSDAASDNAYPKVHLLPPALRVSPTDQPLHVLDKGAHYALRIMFL
jgi:hypothetical protein